AGGRAAGRGGGAVGAAAGAAGRGHGGDRDGTARAGTDARVGVGRDAPAAGAAALPHRHRGAARRRPRGGPPRSGLPLQHRRPAGHREGKPRAPHDRGRARRVHRPRGGRPLPRVDAVARRRADRRRAAAAVRDDPEVGASAARAQARVAHAGGAGAAGRGHAPHRGEAAAEPDRTAQGGRRRSDGARVCRRAEPAVQAAHERGRMSTLRIGTRGSPLALWQARTVASLLAARGVATEIVTYKTSGDRLQEAPLSEVGTKGLFVKELEEALLSGAVDLAVHSAKDMSVPLPDGLTVAAVLPREDPRDAIVLPAGAPVARGFVDVKAALEGGPVIGTSSIRREAQLRELFPNGRFVPVRGNVDTRLRKLDAGDFDAIVLAVAGLKRLGHGDRITYAFEVEHCIPAPCQGIVAIETRVDVPAGIREINDPDADVSFRAERALIAALGGGCQLPLGALVTPDEDVLWMVAIVVSPDGRRRVRVAGVTNRQAQTPEELGRDLADGLARQGAIAILDEVR